MPNQPASEKLEPFMLSKFTAVLALPLLALPAFVLLATVASPLMDRIETNEHHRVALTELRDTLLPRLISGTLRLPESEPLAKQAEV